MRILCTICTEVFDGIRDVSVVPCGHMFHSACLGRWLSQSMTCPQCRNHVTLKSTIHKLFFNQPDANDGDHFSNVTRLESELEEAQIALRQKDREKNDLITEKAAREETLEQLKQRYRYVLQFQYDISASLLVIPWPFPKKGHSPRMFAHFFLFLKIFLHLRLM